MFAPHPRPGNAPSRRALLYGLAGGAVATAGISAACSSAMDGTGRRRLADPLGLDRAVSGLLDGIDADGPYRHPSASERRQAVLASRRLLSGSAGSRTARIFTQLGMELTSGTDTTGRYCDLVTSEVGTPRSWGLLAVERGPRPAHLLVEVPHPGSDMDTAMIGLALFRAVPGSALLVAGAHRSAAGGAADVAHERQSLFHAIAGLLAGRGATQLQLHGYADESMPDEDIVLSAGAGTPGERMAHAADGLAGEGFEVCRAWHGGCDALNGETNVQGRAAARNGHPFVHLEMSRSTRADSDQRAALLRVLAETYRRDSVRPTS